MFVFRWWEGYWKKSAFCDMSNSCEILISLPVTLPIGTQPRPLTDSHAHSLTHLWWSSSLSQLEKMSRKGAWTQGVNDGLWCVLSDWGGVGTQVFLRQVAEVPHLQNRVKSQRGKKRSSFNAEWTFHAWYWCVFMCLDTDTQCYSSMRHCLHSTLELHLPLK